MNLIDKILDMLESRIRKYIDKAYSVGYSTGTADAERRMTKMYEYGYKNGVADTMAVLGEIDIHEVSEEMFKEVSDD